MAKLTQTQIKTKTDEWGQRQTEIERLQAKYDAALAPTVTRQLDELAELNRKHQDELQPIVKKYDPKLSNLQAEAAAIQTEIVGWLEANGKPISLVGEIAEAGYKIGTKIGNRIVDKMLLVDLCRKKQVEIWDCVEVIINRAEKLLGKNEIDAISSKSETPTTSVYLKLKN